MGVLMKILHILVDGSEELPNQLIEAQAPDHEVLVRDLAKQPPDYEEIIAAVFSCDKVICW